MDKEKLQEKAEDYGLFEIHDRLDEIGGMICLLGDVDFDQLHRSSPAALSATLSKLGGEIQSIGEDVRKIFVDLKS